jgi:hypothetical protein
MKAKMKIEDLISVFLDSLTDHCFVMLVSKAGFGALTAYHSACFVRIFYFSLRSR